MPLITFIAFADEPICISFSNLLHLLIQPARHITLLKNFGGLISRPIKLDAGAESVGGKRVMMVLQNYGLLVVSENVDKVYLPVALVDGYMVILTR